MVIIGEGVGATVHDEVGGPEDFELNQKASQLNPPVLCVGSFWPCTNRSQKIPRANKLLRLCFLFFSIAFQHPIPWSQVYVRDHACINSSTALRLSGSELSACSGNTFGGLVRSSW